FASLKATDSVAVVDRDQHKPLERIHIPHWAEGLALAPDGETLYVVAHQKAEFHVIDARSHRLRATVTIEGAPGTVNQLRRVRGGCRPAALPLGFRRPTTATPRSSRR